MNDFFDQCHKASLQGGQAMIPMHQTFPNLLSELTQNTTFNLACSYHSVFISGFAVQKATSTLGFDCTCRSHQH